MTRTKLGLLGLFAVVVGLMSLSASAAQGATLSWLILNSAGATATELKAEVLGKKDSATLILHAKLVGISFLITCHNFATSGVFLEAGGALNNGGKMTFTECNEVTETGSGKKLECTVKSPGAATGTIEAKGKGELILAEEEVQAKVEPETGPEGTFATIKYEGGKCVLPESSVVHGTIVLKDGKKAPRLHQIKHLIEPNPTLTFLYLGKHSAEQLEVTKILGSVWILLGGAHEGLRWAAMDGPPLEEQEPAISWLILNSAGTTATELKAEVLGKKDSATLILHAKLVGISFLITCHNFATSGVFLEAGGALNNGGKMTFTECNEVTETGSGKKLECTVKSPGAATGTIEAKGKGELILAEEEVQAKVEPETGPEGTFATIKYEGGKCVLPESSVVHGTIVLKDGKKAPRLHQIKHLIEPNPTLTFLYLGKHSAEQLEVTKILGSVWILLGGAHEGLRWAAMDGPPLEEQEPAISWLILNSAGTTATELKAEVLGKKDSATLILHAKLVGISFLITCHNFATSGVFLEAGGALNNGGKMTFTECNEVTETGSGKKLECTVKSPGAATGTIEAKGKGELILAEEEVQAKVEPETGPEGTFATIKYEGGKCVLPESSVVHGTIVLKDGKKAPRLHQIKHLIEPNPTLTFLYLGKHSAEQLEVTKILGSVWILLGGAHEGLRWAAMDGPPLEEQEPAISWLILNSAGTTATELKAEVLGKKDSATLILHAKLVGISFLITCHNFATSGVFLEAGGALNNGGKMTFTECNEVTETGSGKKLECTVKSPGAATGTIEAKGKGELILAEEEVQAKVEPETGPEGTFATIKYEGGKCVLPESSVVHGILVLKDCLKQATIHKVEHLAEPNPTLTLLYLGKHSVEQLEITKVLGSGWVRLGGAHLGLAWAAMDV